MINLTTEQKRISKKNRALARQYFGIVGQDNLVLHHIDPELRHKDIERYIQWNIEDLVVLTKGEHTKLHYNDIFTEENKKKMSQPRYGEEHPFYGKKHSEETKRKISESMKGKNKKLTDEEKKKISECNTGRKHTQEEKEKMSKNHYNCSGANNPNYGKDGASKGKHWFNNGEKELYDFTCPEGFVKGRLKRKG